MSVKYHEVCIVLCPTLVLVKQQHAMIRKLSRATCAEVTDDLTELSDGEADVSSCDPSASIRYFDDCDWSSVQAWKSLFLALDCVAGLQQIDN